MAVYEYTNNIVIYRMPRMALTLHPYVLRRRYQKTGY